MLPLLRIAERRPAAPHDQGIVAREATRHVSYQGIPNRTEAHAAGCSNRYRSGGGMPMNKRMAHILVVDDEPSIRSLMAVTLKLAGYEVTEAGGGEEALGLIERTPFDLIVLDIMMPVTDVYEVLQPLRAMSVRA